MHTIKHIDFATTYAAVYKAHGHSPITVDTGQGRVVFDERGRGHAEADVFYNGPGRALRPINPGCCPFELLDGIEAALDADYHAQMTRDMDFAQGRPSPRDGDDVVDGDCPF